ncbi:MAG: hypothetical protein F4Z31_01730 [Gemmatimonadetes bacterium]|nr:hypothetical protein [Gemmatimonadota bacterium]
MRARARLVIVAIGGALVAGVLWVWPLASIRDGRSAEVEAAASRADALDAQLAAHREAVAAGSTDEAAEHRRFSENLEEHLESMLDNAALAAWSESPEPRGDTPLAFLSEPEARWRAETQAAAALIEDFAVAVAEVSVSDPQPVEGLNGLEMAGATFRVAVDSLEDAIALSVALDSRPDAILDEVRVSVDDGPQGTGLWWTELSLRWYRLPDTLEQR